MRSRHAVIAFALVLAASGTAAAYPQFQLSRDQTCSGCHLSPAGGGLLNENGMSTAESISQYGTAPEFFYNKATLPSWLMFGGDLRGAAGYFRTPQNSFADIPMQAEVYGHATFGHFSIQADVGARPPQYENEDATYIWSREHYIMYQSDEGSSDGLFIRVGRFMPVMGLRLAEHVDYTRIYGGTPLYAETYGVAVEYIQPKFELHASAFMKDPLIDPVVNDNGGALYGEYRTSEATSLGLETMITYTDDDRKYRYGITAKHYIASQDLLLMFEGQFVNQVIVAGGAPLQIVATGMASKFIGKAFLLDLALNFYDEDIRYDTLDRDALDLNLHWFATSHLELIWQNRVEATVGPTGAWSLIQAHYRL